METNQSQSPNNLRESPTKGKVSFARGLLYALPAAAGGFVVPYFVFSQFAFFRRGFLGGDAFRLREDLRGLSGDLVPAIGCAMVFALAAILNYMPARKMGFVRALMLVGLSALLSAVITGVATVLFGLGPQTYTYDPYVMVRCAIAVAVPIISTAGLLCVVIRRQTREKSAGHSRRSGTGG